MAVTCDPRPLVIHVVHRFDTGGLENGVANLINHMPETAYRHAVLALTEVTDFRLRVCRPDVGFISLRKASGHGVRAYPRLWRLFREMRPEVVHTRNLGPLEMQVVAALAGVPARVHGEHGRELNDVEGNNKRLQTVRRLYAPFVHRYIALSHDLEQYLSQKVGIEPQRISQIYNGVDSARFRPGKAGPEPVEGDPFSGDGLWRIGTVGRMQGVKDQVLLARAFVRALEMQPEMRKTARLVMVGEGPLRAQSQALLDEAGVGALAWLPGGRSDVAEVMRGLNCFVLPSLAEGISNTILEAMATGLPVVATAVGGNVELVDNGRTGLVVAPADVEGMAKALVTTHAHPERATSMGRAGRAEVEHRFSLQAMVHAYQAVYDRQLAAAGIPRLEN